MCDIYKLIKRTLTKDMKKLKNDKYIILENVSNSLSLFLHFLTKTVDKKFQVVIFRHMFEFHIVTMSIFSFLFLFFLTGLRVLKA